MPLKIVFRTGPHVLNRIQLRGVRNIEDAGYTSLLELLLHDLAVVDPAVVQEEGDLLRGVSGQDLVDIFEKALGVDGLRLHDKGLEPILGRYPSQHSDRL